jgi:hypothetical protein
VSRGLEYRGKRDEYFEANYEADVHRSAFPWGCCFSSRGCFNRGLGSCRLLLC